MDQRLRCKACQEELPYTKRQYNSARRYHWRFGAEICQGLLRRAQGNRGVIGRSLMELFGSQPHYGRVLYQHEELVYQGRTDARTQWRVQFEDGEEYDMDFDQIMRGHALLNETNPGRLIEIPYDRGENGRPGAITGRGAAQQTQDEEDEEDAESESEGNGNDVGGAIGDDVHEFDHEDDDDQLTFPAEHFHDLDKLEYLGGAVSPGSAVNILTHIIRTLSDKKGSSSNRGVIDCFNRERDAFEADLPKTWDTMLKVLDVPSLASTVRHMCPDGHRVWRFLPDDMYEFHKDDKCDVCNAARFHTVKGQIKPVRVLYYLGLEHVLANFFTDPKWAKAWKKDLDKSINGVHQSEHVRLMDNHFLGAVLQPDAGLFSCFDDGFTACANGTNGITVFGLMTHDVGPMHFARDLNRRPLMLVSPPEPSNSSLLLEELIEDIHKMADIGIRVNHEGRTFTYKAFLFSWMADAIARMKLHGIGGPGKYIGCSNCWQRSSYLVGTTWYPAGYAVPIRHWLVEGGEQYVDLFAGDAFWQRSHTRLAEIYRDIRMLEADVKEGVFGAATRLSEEKQLSGFSFGDCKFESLKYCDLRNLVRTAPCHQFLLGIIKKDYFGGLFTMFGPTAGAAWFRRHDERQQVSNISWCLCSTCCFVMMTMKVVVVLVMWFILLLVHSQFR